MQQSNKRSKVAKESIIPNITESVVKLSETLNSIGATHQLLLQANDIFVKYLLEEEKKKKSKVIIPPTQHQDQEQNSRVRILSRNLQNQSLYLLKNNSTIDNYIFVKMDPDSKAVSFTNSYFALADGLVTGIEYFLAENVVLDWFGKTIKGRNNVAAFLSTHKVNSRHVFDDISPSDNIGYNKKSNRRRRKRKPKSLNISLQNENISCENDFNGQSTPLNESISSNDQSNSWTKSYCSTEEEIDITIELHDNTLSNIFKLESIKSTDIDEIEQKIRQLSLKDKRFAASPRTSRNVRDLEHAMKFVEAYGEILFSKKSKRQSSWNDYKLIPSGSTQTWRKPCKLQIAYSSQQGCLQSNPPNNNNHFECNRKQVLLENPTKLLNFEQIIDIGNQLVPNVNDYSGYLRQVANDKEQGLFFENFNEYLLKNQKTNASMRPCYCDDQLCLQKFECKSHIESENNFLFNDLIHIIIYEGRSRCRMNLSQKF